MATQENAKSLNYKKTLLKNGDKGRGRFNLFTLGVGLDLPLLIIVISLVGIGLVMLFSTSYASAYYSTGDSYAYIRDQAVFAVVGIIAMLIISTVDYHQYKRFSKIIFAVSILLLLLVLVPALSASRGEATRWIVLGPVSFQPSEIAKFTLVVMLATILSKSRIDSDNLKKVVLPSFGVAILVAGLVAAERHISATIIILCISLVVMFVGGIRVRYFVMAGIPVILVLIYLIFFSDAFAYTLTRVQGWIDPFNPPEGVDTYQTVQSLYAIGSGELLGVGLGQSTQKYMYLPEARNDFIFAIVCEELGFVGAMFIILLFAALIWRGVVISMNAKDKFGMLLGMGMTFTVGIQAIFNICVVTNAFPNTGISLPFFSDGGTSLLMLLGEMGVLLSVSRGAYMEKV